MSSKDKRSKKNMGPLPVQAQSAPWTWIFLALAPLVISGGLYLAEYSSKILWVSLVLSAALLMRFFQKSKVSEIGISIPEILWLGYMFIGVVAMSWSLVPVLGFERLSYLCLGISAYLVAKRTRFWESSLYWQVFAGTALLVSLIGAMNYFFAGTALGFDWIPSAGRPSSTLGYRAYAASYLALAIPFLLWYVFSNHTRTRSRLALGISALIFSFVFLAQTRARSEWLGIIISCTVMGLLVLQQKKIRYSKTSFSIAGVAALVLILLINIPAGEKFSDADKTVQPLAKSKKTSISSTVKMMFDAAISGNIDRLIYWKTAHSIMTDKSVKNEYEGPFGTPYLGWGIGMAQFPVVAMLYNEQAIYHLYIELHNDWLQALLELGPLGFICFTGFMLSLLWYAWRIRHTGLGIACIGVVLAWFFSTQLDFALPRIYCMLAIAAVAAIIDHKAAVPDIFTWERPASVRFVPLLGGLFTLYIFFANSITTYWDRQIYGALQHQDEKVDVIYKKMTDPNSLLYYRNGHGKFLFCSILEELMVTAQKSYVDFPPQKQGNAGGARDIRLEIIEGLARELLHYDPYNANYLMRAASVCFDEKRFAAALPILDKLLELQPRNMQVLKVKAQALAAVGKPGSALRVIEQNIQSDSSQHAYWKKNLPGLYQQYIAGSQ